MGAGVTGSPDRKLLVIYGGPVLVILTGIVYMMWKLDIAHLANTGDYVITPGTPNPNDCDFIRTELNVLDHDIEKAAKVMNKDPLNEVARSDHDKLVRERNDLARKCGHTSAYGDH